MLECFPNVEGTVIILDDLVVFGKSKEEHDKWLPELLVAQLGSN